MASDSATNAQLFAPTLSQRFERRRDGTIVREITTASTRTRWRLPGDGPIEGDPARAWFKRRLRRPADGPEGERTLRIVDLFSGAGGFAAGFRDAAAAAGYRTSIEAALDMDRVALATHAKNLKTRRRIEADAALCVEYALRTDGDLVSFPFRPELIDERLAEVGSCDVVIGGPPCQGHSNLNNHTRRADFRNGLYFVVPAIAVALNAPIVIIENVTTVIKDHQKVVPRAKALLQSEGYEVCEMTLKAEAFGVAQLRRRHFLVAVKGAARLVPELVRALEVPPLGAMDAIGDLIGRKDDTDYDRATELLPANAERVRYLFDNGVYDLPNAQRPECHRDGHTYPSVYGRMHPHVPAGTITGGFLQPGQGRFIHPTEPRSLTPHEGARLQGFPDDHEFVGPNGRAPTRKECAQMIGDAVPPPLAFAASLVALSAYQARA